MFTDEIFGFKLQEIQFENDLKYMAHIIWLVVYEE